MRTVFALLGFTFDAVCEVAEKLEERYLPGRAERLSTEEYERCRRMWTDGTD